MSENIPSYSIAVPVFVLKDRDISPTAKLLYGVIDSFLRKSGVCYATNSRLAEEMAGCGERTISRCIAELKDAGYIKVGLASKTKDKKVRRITLYVSVEDGQGVDKNGDTPSPILATPLANIGEKVIQEVIEKENKKEKEKKQLSLQEMRPLFVDWIQTVAQPEWTREEKNGLFERLNAFYDPERAVKKGLPPVRSKRGFTAMGNLLMKWSSGDPRAMMELIDVSIGNGWTGIQPPRNGFAPRAAVPEGRVYEQW